MRAISLINHLEFDFNGSVVRKGVTLGDVDNDGNYELVVGNENGDVVIFKALEKWQTITDLGFVSCVIVGDILNRNRNYLVIVTADGWVSCVIVGDILNRNRNYLVIVTADGWCYIYSAAQGDVLDSFDSRDFQSDKRSDQTDGQSASADTNNSPKSDSLLDDTTRESDKTFLRRIHVQRIPPNTKDILLGDIDGDGLVEMVVGLTDRVVRSYRWCDSDTIESSIGEERDENTSLGKLVALNKWECAQQIGSISLHHSLDGVPSLLVAQPGGTFMRIHHQSEEQQLPQTQDGASMGDSNSLPNENLTGFSVDYQFLGISRMRNPNISSEILGDVRTIPNLNNSTDSDRSDRNNGGKVRGNPYAIATLDGTIMLLQDEVILWAIAVDHQLFALTKLDVTGNGADEIVVCSWDGHTYILDQYKNTVRFQLDESVQVFETGYYTLIPGEKPVTCFVYITFRNKILLYFDIPLKRMVSKKFEPFLPKLSDVIEPEDDKVDKQQFLDNLDKDSKKDLVQYLLYGLNVD
ncbi:Integrin-alpha FG-GAP repeat-containing protein 2 [Popillia japonica]|uniref:Integrin-alpha FG-GAP repeat-containing protein 2 n=1 Tax=Popillia japonica TaxID=7064 RepID=A0AAW1KJ70_POPJA